ncbi:ABC transporter ATP-binding protein [Nocardia sp. NPDC058658]|uniref:ABC transporter ATP-binding protein n=1 Tax=Nocardia sp. NPDC058658 TaxID=3346580 RepID=UPI003669BE0F
MIVEVADVVREYSIGNQRVRALDHVSVTIHGGEFVSVMGPSGAGKSTFLHLLGALDTVGSGSIRFNDREIGSLSEEERAKFRLRSVGFVFQFFNLLPTMTAWENVAVPQLFAGHRLAAARTRALELLELVGMGHRTEHRPAELSGGQMQRVAVARALMMNPPLILADEPTGNLDSRAGAEILELLRDIAHDEGQSRSVVMVTHDVAAAGFTDRRITLRDGKLCSIELSTAAQGGSE